MKFFLVLLSLFFATTILAEDNSLTPIPLSKWENESNSKIDLNGDNLPDNVFTIAISDTNKLNEDVKYINLMANYQKVKNDIALYKFKTGLPTEPTLALEIALSGKCKQKKTVFYNAEYFPTPAYSKMLSVHLVKKNSPIYAINKRLMPIKNKAKGDVLEIIGCVGACSDSSPNISYLYWDGREFILFMDDEIGGD